MVKVVLIEDEELLREGLLRTTPWAEHGFDVVGYAGDAVEGERVILDTRPDLVITDIRLPKVAGSTVISGLDLIESLTEKIMCDYIIISGYDAFDYAQRAIFLGVKAYLLKPIDDQELLLTLDKIASNIAHRKEIERVLSQSDTARHFPEPAAPRPEKSLGDRYMDAATEYLRDHFTDNITVKQVADTLLISESYLTKLFRRKSGHSFLDTLTQLRMEEAARLLRESDLKVYEVASHLGYQDTQYFSTLFRRVIGQTPSDYKHVR